MTLEDELQCRLFNEFYEKNKELFMKDTIGYWKEARRYVEREGIKQGYYKSPK